MAGTTKRIYEFGDFRLDVEERLLLRGGAALPLTPKLFDTLLLLVENSGHLLLKDELMKRLWPDSFVDEVNLSQNISRLRRVLGETPGQQYVATVAGQGYRFIVDVRELTDGNETPSALAIESHTRERVVVEEDDGQDAAALTIARPVQRRRSFWRRFWLISTAITAAMLVWVALPSKQPRLLAAKRVTNDGYSKWQGYQGPALVTDGSRIFTVENVGGKETLAQVSTSGGKMVALPSPFALPQVTDLD